MMNTGRRERLTSLLEKPLGYFFSMARLTAMVMRPSSGWKPKPSTRIQRHRARGRFAMPVYSNSPSGLVSCAMRRRLPTSGCHQPR